MAKLAVRWDIEGLRGIAVLAILLFHLDARLCPSGFIGVDIFFVISGFLITRLIVAEGDAFSFRRFYVRRFFRLFPALQATLTASLVAAWWVLPPSDYLLLAKSAAAALIGLSNFYFMTAIDYFNAANIYHPLLHTWSLGVEEQFYLFWPALLLARRKCGLSLGAVAGAAAVCSLGLLFLPLPAKPDYAFYMMPFRIFEFAIGAALVGPQGQSRVLVRGAAGLGLVSVAALAGALVLIDPKTLWPGPWTLVPALATAGLLVAGEHGLWRRILSFGPLRSVGRMSYALYLVHWPVIALAQFYSATPLGPRDLGILFVLSLALGAVLHFAIEQPFRLWTPEFTRPSAMLVNWRRWRSRFVALGSIVFVGLVLGIVTKEGVPSRLDRSRIQALDRGLTFAGDLCDARRSRCVFGDRGAERTVYLVGDSHALNLVYGLDAFFREVGVRGIALYDHGCLFAYGTARFKGDRINQSCQRNVAEAYASLAGNRDPVILAGAYAGYFGEIGFADGRKPERRDIDGYYAWVGERLSESVRRLGVDDRRIIVMKHTYSTGIDLPKCMARPGLAQDAIASQCVAWTRSQAFAHYRASDQMIDGLKASAPGLTIIDPKSVFCPQERCLTEDGDGPYFRDESHLTNSGSQFLVERLRSEWVAALGLSPQTGSVGQKRSSVD